MNKGCKSTIIISLIMSLILILVAVLMWPNKDVIASDGKRTQSNAKDDSKVQIEIIAKRINIREDHNIDSNDLGDVYLGEIYTVLEDYESDDYYWYKITTNTNITGYIASLKDDEYVKIISGYIDRTPPVINYDKSYYILNDDNDYSKITCTDDHSDCSINITKDDLYLYVTATDQKGNKTEKSFRLYEVYEGGNYFTEWNDNLTINYTKQINDDNSMNLSATYILKKMIKSSSKSNNYEVSVNLYDEDFNLIEDYSTKYNSKELDKECKNDKDMKIKEEYKDDDLNIGDKLCFNYYNKDHTNVKYIELSISGVDNTDKNDNFLSNYSSRLIIK